MVVPEERLKSLLAYLDASYEHADPAWDIHDGSMTPDTHDLSSSPDPCLESSSDVACRVALAKAALESLIHSGAAACKSPETYINIPLL